jgi:hypothetical protein
MNERIEELAQGCFEYFGGTDIVEFNYKKFAELIVRECARIVNENDCEGSIVGDGMLFEHFGVEE